MILGKGTMSFFSVCFFHHSCRKGYPFIIEQFWQPCQKHLGYYGLCCVLIACTSVLLRALNSLDCFTSVKSFEIKEVLWLLTLFFCKNVLAIWYSLRFSLNLGWAFKFLQKRPLGFWYGDCIESIDFFVKYWYLNVKSSNLWIWDVCIFLIFLFLLFSLWQI